MLELILKIAILVTLLRMNNLLTGGLPFWQKGAIYGIACIGLKIMVFLGVLGNHGIATGITALVVYGVIALAVSCAYFFGVDRVPGRFNTPFTILGAILLVLLI